MARRKDKAEVAKRARQLKQQRALLLDRLVPLLDEERQQELKLVTDTFRNELLSLITRYVNEYPGLSWNTLLGALEAEKTHLIMQLAGVETNGYDHGDEDEDSFDG